MQGISYAQNSTKTVATNFCRDNEQYGVFSHDVKAAILVSQNNETAAILVSQTSPLELNYFLMQTLSFVPINLHRCWPRERKHSIDSFFSYLVGVFGDCAEFSPFQHFEQ